MIRKHWIAAVAAVAMALLPASAAQSVGVGATSEYREDTTYAEARWLDEVTGEMTSVSIVEDSEAATASLRLFHGVCVRQPEGWWLCDDWTDIETEIPADDVTVDIRRGTARATTQLDCGSLDLTWTGTPRSGSPSPPVSPAVWAGSDRVVVQTQEGRASSDTATTTTGTACSSAQSATTPGDGYIGSAGHGRRSVFIETGTP